MKWPFFKMHGCGNSMVVVSMPQEQQNEASHWARLLCSLGIGIGSDGLMLIDPDTLNPIHVAMYNPDGSPMGMCGNGIRCVVRYLMEIMKRGPGEGGAFHFIVEGRSITCWPIDNGRQVRVDMGAPVLEAADIPCTRTSILEQPITAAGQTFTSSAIGMGNPHCVIFCDDVAGVALQILGPALEHHPEYPKRTNVTFAQVLSRTHLKARVWERGAGVTLACGTAACATAVAAFLTNRTERELTVSLPGGDLLIDFNESDNRVYMTGPAAFVGEIKLADEMVALMGGGLLQGSHGGRTQ